MSTAIIGQLGIDVEKLLSKQDKLVAKPVSFTAHLREDIASTSKTALLQVNIAADINAEVKLSSALELLSKKFKSVTILLDMELALLSYRIILPYMPKEQLQNIITRRKLEWLATNIAAIKKTKLSRLIVIDTYQRLEQAKEENILIIDKFLTYNHAFRKHIAEDVELLKNELSSTHNISKAMYSQANYKNDKLIELYLIGKIAAIAAMSSQYSSKHSNKHSYVGLIKMHSYNYLQKTAAMEDLPSYLSLYFTKTTTSESKQLLTSTEINQNLYEFDLLGKISARKSYLEKAAKHFPGNVYLQSLNRTLLASNKEHSLSFGVAEESYLIGKYFEHLLPQEDADKIAEIVTEITTTNKVQTLIEGHQYPLSNESSHYLSIKIPLINKKNRVLGVIGFSTQIKDEVEIRNLKKLEGATGPAGLMQAFVAGSIIAENKTYDTGYMKTIIENMPGLVFWQDINGKILGCNQNQADFLGLDKDAEIIGKYPKDFLTAEQVKEALRDLAEITKTSESIIKEELYKHGDKLIAMLSHKTAIKDNTGKILGIMVVALEARQEQQREIIRFKEQLTSATEFKNKFVNTLKHELQDLSSNSLIMAQEYKNQETCILKKQQLLEISGCAKDTFAFSEYITTNTNIKDTE
jgi:PAS domain S-box-containing protein